jgi:YebC/PmpR family DNA-binding regulatory protein
LTTAARSGLPDPNMNPRLRAALTAARTANMARDTIERAIKRGAGGEDATNYEEVRYEGYGPGGIAIIVEALTDNRNRSASEVRTAFNKHGGAMGESNSVSFMFERKGMVRYPAKAASADAMFEAALEAGADNVESDGEAHEATSAPEDFAQLRDRLEAKFGPPLEARLIWRPTTNVRVDGETAERLLKLIEALDDNDDVQTVSANFDVADDVLARLTA